MTQNTTNAKGETMTTRIRTPKTGEVMVELGTGPDLQRRHVPANRADDFARRGWVIWIPAGTGWKRSQNR